MGLTVYSKVNPLDLAINKRYGRSQALTPEVKLAMQTLQGEVFDEVAANNGFQAYPKYILLLTFYFPGKRGDIDGPVKHAIDALEAGVNQFYQGKKVFNDSQIFVLTVYKYIGVDTYGLDINLYGSDG